jgi:hypothetical protein
MGANRNHPVYAVALETLLKYAILNQVYAYLAIAIPVNIGMYIAFLQGSRKT